MSYTKKAHEVQAIEEGGKRMGEILDTLVDMVRPGVLLSDIDAKAEALIIAAGGVPAFKGYRPRGISTPFPGTICASVNDEVVHGIPGPGRMLLDGDIFTIDIGMRWPEGKGYFTDTAVTVAVGKPKPEALELMRVTRESLEVGIRECVAGKTIADIGRAIENYVKSQGEYGIVRDLCGHGVGHAVHEAPFVLNYYDRKMEEWELKPGVVLALEPMITLGDWRVNTKEDDWTIVTADGSLAAHYEHTVIITDGEPVVATRRASEVV